MPDEDEPLVFGEGALLQDGRRVQRIEYDEPTAFGTIHRTAFTPVVDVCDNQLARDLGHVSPRKETTDG